MAGQCKGYCDNMPYGPFGAKYKHGYKYCCKCDKFFMTESNFCECCRNQLRVRSVKQTKVYI